MLRAVGVAGFLPLLLGCQTLLGLHQGDPRNDGGGGSAAGTGGSGGSSGTGGSSGGGLPAFDEPEIIGELAGGANTDDPTVTSDLLTMFFNRGSDIWVTDRLSADLPWSNERVIASLSTAADETNCRLSPDGLIISFGRKPLSAGDSFVQFAQRSDPDDPEGWMAPQPIDELNQAGSDTHVGSVTPDGLYMLFERRMDDDDLWHIYEARRAAEGDDWGDVAYLRELDVGALSSRQPWLSPNGRRVYFDAGNQSVGNIYMATRDGLDAPFDTPVMVGGVSSSDVESDVWLSSDERYIVFSRREAGDMTSNDIYEAHRIQVSE